MGGDRPPDQGRWRWNGREWVDTTQAPAPPWRLIGWGVAVALVLAAILFAVVGRITEAPAPATGLKASSTPTPTAHPLASATPSQTPAPVPPPSTASIKAVTVALNGACAAGGACALEVTVEFPLTTAETDFAWSLAATDACTGTVTPLGDQHVTAQVGWNHVVGDTTVTLPPARGPIRIGATSTSPSQAASAPLQVGSGAC